MKTSRIKSLTLLIAALLVGSSSLVSAQEAAGKDIVAVAKESVGRGKPLHATLVKLLDAAGLTETLKTGGPYTLFAPTDDAFATLPKGKLEELQKPENKEQLIAVLKNHVVSGKLVEAELAKQTEVTSLAGKPLAITTKGGLVKKVAGVDTANDQSEASNGIVYRIKKVLLP